MTARRVPRTDATAVSSLGPVYIGGLDRTGKTTMRAFLGSHPNLSIPAVGSNMWTYFYRRFGDLSDPENLDRCLAAMMSYKHVRFLQPDEERIRADFAVGPSTYANLFSIFLQHHAEREGKPRWGAQTGLIERYAHQMFAAYPGLRIVHMVRDPRDRYEASLARWPDGKGRAGGAAARFVYSARLGESHFEEFGPDRYMIVRFEDMVGQPEATVRNVCAFIGEDFVPAMMDMGNAPQFRAKLEASGDGSTGSSALSETFIGRYHDHVPPAEVAFIEAAARRSMQAHGYEPTASSASAAERLRTAAAVWPGQAARFAMWTGIEHLQQRMPRLVKRRIGSRMIVSDR